ncbi:angiotensin-converting enzyme-like [Penaeus japonicus]|uniref:angiotensin-converting enzyme-like n=1 Tax=Penaeus japonicus TaxID=27405 RepID=UPI001C70D676|nr:angiotensin-converting enzyme-like [Penaeus japonicus]
MRSLYTSVTLRLGDLTLHGERDVTSFMRTSRDPELLLWAWISWRDALGPPLRPLFARTVEVANVAARRGGYPDMGTAWQDELDFSPEEDVRTLVEDLYNEVAPLYTLLHARVRHSLAEQYGGKVVDVRQPIPAHLLGDLWGQNWISLIDIILREHGSLSTAAKSKEDNKTVREMVKFWSESILGDSEAPRNTTCHPRSLDMFSPGDYRCLVVELMIMCNIQGEEGQAVAYHELGHIYYFQSYSHQPTIFRDGANSAFHETIGDTVQLSAMAPACQDRSKVNSYQESPQMEANRRDKSSENLSSSELRHLLTLALQKLPLFAFARVMDEWRWGVFRGERHSPEIISTSWAEHQHCRAYDSESVIPEQDYNKWWWRLTLQYQGLAPPSPRSERHFDPAAKFHLADNIPFIRYFVAVVAQFQLHQALCETSQGKVHIGGRLHTCCIKGSTEAGRQLRWVLSQGASTSWQEILEAVTGSRNLEASHLRSYFSPLTSWLEREVVRLNLTLGCPPSAPSPQALRAIHNPFSFVFIDEKREPITAVIG